MGIHRLQIIARHIHGNEEMPLWVGLMDAGLDQVLRPANGCRCTSEKWRYICNCYPCLRWAGREEDFEWTSDVMAAQPAIPAQWRRALHATALKASERPERPERLPERLPRAPPPLEEDLVVEEAGGMRRTRLPGSSSPFGPVDLSELPRFAGIATFARLPQLHELRSMQVPCEGLLRVSSESSELLLRFNKRTQRVQATEELRVALGLEDSGPLEIEVNGRTSRVALWSLPNAWHRHSMDGVVVDLRLEKRYPKFDIALLGVPFDSGCSYRPGARFGSEAIRSNSRLTRPYLIEQQQRPLQERQVVDTGDVLATPFNISKAVEDIYEACKKRLEMSRRLLLFGGDHTLSYPTIKAVAEKFGRLVLIHFDSHLDTFPNLWGQDVWHGAPFRNCWEEGLLAKDGSTHIGIRASTYSAEDFHDSEKMGISTLTADDVHRNGVDACVDVVRRRWEASGGRINVL